MFQFSFLRVKKELPRFPYRVIQDRKTQTRCIIVARESVKQKIMSSHRHFSRSSNFRSRHVVRFESPRYNFSLSWTKIEREKIRGRRTGTANDTIASIRIGQTRVTLLNTRASSSIRCRLAFLRGRPGVYKYDIPWHAKQCRCIIDHVSHTRCCSYFKTFPIWYEEF